MSFADKVVLITGAGSGIGRGIALHFSKLSAKLSLIDINSENISNVAQECENISKMKAFTVTTDLGDIKNTKYVVDCTKKAYGKIDVLINCAGISGSGGVTSDVLMENLDKVININLLSHIALTNYASDALIESKGCVINISSIFGTSCIQNGIPYAVAKAGMIHFTKCAALELSEKGVRVNSISPGPVSTNILMNAGMSKEISDKFWQNMANQVPLKELVSAEEIGEVAALIASDQGSTITGCDYIIDSGMSLKRFTL
nr:3-oxoacyl-[acyl-carrier-protein] reductase FabG-like [Danaus plexippus plexippus]